ncbi:hypothetical protein APSETT445_004182 [Aspergillus pseudonomiae]
MASKVLVLMYSLCILFYNRWATRKHAAADAQKTIQDAEQRPMLSETNEVPFGARALERGVLVEGIWTPGQVSPIEPNTPTRHESAGPVLTQLPPNPASMVQRPSQTYMPVSLSGQSGPRWAPAVSDIRAESSDSLYPNALHANKSRQSEVQLVGSHHDVVDSDVARSKVRLSSCGSWINKPFDKRLPAVEGFSLRQQPDMPGPRDLVTASTRPNPQQIVYRRIVRRHFATSIDCKF